VRYVWWGIIVLVDVIAPSRARYRTSLPLFDYDCEIMWVDEIERE
jgi:hypothetical protein